MCKNSYKDIVKHYEDCLEEHGDNHLGVDWPNEQDALTRYKVMLDLVKEKGASILDFGCGTAHLKAFMESQGTYDFLIYSGCDLSKKFVDISKKKFPKCEFYTYDILKDPIDAIPDSDYIVLNGVFTEKRKLSYDEMLNYFQKMIYLVFQKAKKGIAFNVMSKAVDWEREDLFHLSKDVLVDIMVPISRNFVIRNDYGLYEYTTYLYK
ncbi:class I SAM-dependent methyltransferase [uncultured Dokdonia sp.]|uniref:class I SAM-dependent methyltransferase n=1 Tax=uncultured Dokdonia sp. TaxID=575653 RepID=UPI0030EF95D4|tara:strand:+ start:44004 stop:44627 length:624 start_codon:yes stop_codon:yes gene_type:complete